MQKRILKIDLGHLKPNPEDLTQKVVRHSTCGDVYKSSYENKCVWIHRLPRPGVLLDENLKCFSNWCQAGSELPGNDEKLFDELAKGLQGFVSHVLGIAMSTFNVHFIYSFGDYEPIPLSLMLEKPLSLDARRVLVQGLSLEIQRLHQTGRYHAHLKPENIWVCLPLSQDEKKQGKTLEPRVFTLFNYMSSLVPPDVRVYVEEIVGVSHLPWVCDSDENQTMDIWSFSSVAHFIFHQTPPFQEFKIECEFWKWCAAQKGPLLNFRRVPGLSTHDMELLEACSHSDPSKRPTAQQLLWQEEVGHCEDDLIIK